MGQAFLRYDRESGRYYDVDNPVNGRDACPIRPLTRGVASSAQAGSDGGEEVTEEEQGFWAGVKEADVRAALSAPVPQRATG